MTKSQVSITYMIVRCELVPCCRISLALFYCFDKQARQAMHVVTMCVKLVCDCHKSHVVQVLGLLRPARKRRGDFAQKLVFHSGHTDMEL